MNGSVAPFIDDCEVSATEFTVHQIVYILSTKQE